MQNYMVDLNELIVCSVCHADLLLEHPGKEGLTKCSACKTEYGFKDGLYDMTPNPLPDGHSQPRWSTWRKLQENGLVSYSSAPEFNLSVGARKDSLAFKNFCEMSGLILDIGCGPQRSASYMPDVDEGDIVGIDPLAGAQPRAFSFVQGVGEYLPFRDVTFDHALYATSLDHVVDPKRSLAEAARCLKFGGCINLWLDAQAAEHLETDSSKWGRYRLLAKKGFRSLSRGGWISNLGIRRTVAYVASVARMNVPEGAIDYFHFDHLTPESVRSMLSELNMKIIRESQLEDNLFIQAKK